MDFLPEGVTRHPNALISKLRGNKSEDKQESESVSSEKSQTVDIDHSKIYDMMSWSKSVLEDLDDVVEEKSNNLGDYFGSPRKDNNSKNKSSDEEKISEKNSPVNSRLRGSSVKSEDSPLLSYTTSNQTEYGADSSKNVDQRGSKSGFLSSIFSRSSTSTSKTSGFTSPLSPKSSKSWKSNKNESPSYSKQSSTKTSSDYSPMTSYLTEEMSMNSSIATGYNDDIQSMGSLEKFLASEKDMIKRLKERGTEMDSDLSDSESSITSDDSLDVGYSSRYDRNDSIDSTFDTKNFNINRVEEKAHIYNKPKVDRNVTYADASTSTSSSSFSKSTSSFSSNSGNSANNSEREHTTIYVNQHIINEAPTSYRTRPIRVVRIIREDRVPMVDMDGSRYCSTRVQRNSTWGRFWSARGNDTERREEFRRNLGLSYDSGDDFDYQNYQSNNRSNNTANTNNSNRDSNSSSTDKTSTTTQNNKDKELKEIKDEKKEKKDDHSGNNGNINNSRSNNTRSSGINNNRNRNNGPRVVSRGPNYEEGNMFNNVCRCMKQIVVKFSYGLMLLFWVLSMYYVYVSITSEDWMINEVNYKKGDITGKSTTLIGITGISRNDVAYLKNGEKMELNRGFMSYKDIIGSEEKNGNSNSNDSNGEEEDKGKKRDREGVGEQEQENSEENKETKKEKKYKRNKDKSKTDDDARRDKTSKKKNKSKKTEEKRRTVDGRGDEGLNVANGNNDNNNVDEKRDGGIHKVHRKNEHKRKEEAQEMKRGIKIGEVEVVDEEDGIKENRETEIERDEETRQEEIDHKQELDRHREEKNKEREESEEEELKRRDIEEAKEIRRKMKEMGMKVDKKIKYYTRCIQEIRFIKRSSCFRHLCEVGNLNEKETLYFKILYGPTFYDLHYKELPNLKSAGNSIKNLSIFTMIMLSIAIMLMLEIVGSEKVVERIVLVRNIGRIILVGSIIMSVTGAFIWSSVSSKAICVGEDGLSKPCERYYASRTYILHLICSILVFVFYLVNNGANPPEVCLEKIRKRKEGRGNRNNNDDKFDNDNSDEKKESKKEKEQELKDKKDEDRSREDKEVETQEKQKNKNNENEGDEEKEENGINMGEVDRYLGRDVNRGVVEIGRLEDVRTISLIDEPDV